MPWRAAVKLNAWAVVALVTINLTRWSLRAGDHSVAARMLLAVAPLLPTLLYVLGLVRWIGRLDELQQRIQLGAWAFATTGAVLVLLTLELLQFAEVVRGFRLGLEGVFVLTFALYLLGCAMGNRRLE